MSNIHWEMRTWREHLKQSRVSQKPSPQSEMPYEGEFIGE